MPLPAHLADKLAALPAEPGVYLMLDREGVVFYVGKAKSLRDRVRSYFSGSDTRGFVARLSELLADVEVIVVSNEKEALLVENDLIKRHQPRHNVDLKDDKRFLCLAIDPRERYPRLKVTRRMAKDGARHFGPFHSAGAIREVLRLVNRHFQLRTCSDHVLAHRSRPCLQHQIKRCPAPCVYDLSHGEYAAHVDDVIAFLEGRRAELATQLEQRMRAKAAALDFEGAALLRDQLRAIERSLEKQRVVSSDLANRDVVGLYREGPQVEVHVMRTRAGRLIDALRFSLENLEQDTAEVLADFGTRFYLDPSTEVPDEVLLPREFEWTDGLSQTLTERVGRRVAVHNPQRGEKRRLVELAERNARQAFADKQREAGAAKSAIERLQRALHLARPPETLECFDISHTQGGEIVASSVAFERGLPRKDRYRHYVIRSTAGQDDFQSLYEAVSRRLRRGLEDGDLPDLLVIDGGRGQLNAARAALDDHGVDTLEVVSLAKSRALDEPTEPTEPAADGAHATDGATHSPERVFVLGQKNPIVLRQNSAELFLLTRARDEAHRFAITHHRRRRAKRALHTVLDDIPGIGPERKKKLLRTFGSVARLREASLEQLTRAVGANVAESLHAALQGASRP